MPKVIFDCADLPTHVDYDYTAFSVIVFIIGLTEASGLQHRYPYIFLASYTLVLGPVNPPPLITVLNLGQVCSFYIASVHNSVNEYLVIDSGGLCPIIAAWLNTSNISRDGVRLNICQGMKCNVEILYFIRTYQVALYFFLKYLSNICYI